MKSTEFENVGESSDKIDGILSDLKDYLIDYIFVFLDENSASEFSITNHDEIGNRLLKAINLIRETLKTQEDLDTFIPVIHNLAVEIMLQAFSTACRKQNRSGMKYTGSISEDTLKILIQSMVSKDIPVKNDDEKKDAEIVISDMTEDQKCKMQAGIRLSSQPIRAKL